MNQVSKMICIRLLSVNKTNCDDLCQEFLYEILNWYYLCTFLTSGNSIWLWRNFDLSRIFAGFGKNAGFWLELESGATHYYYILILHSASGYASMVTWHDCT